MNTSYDLNSTPKAMNRNTYDESLMDFSTPMSTVPSHWTENKNFNETNKKTFSDCDNNSTINNDMIIEMKPNNNDNNMTILDKFVQKLNEHKVNFYNTQRNLNLLDGHLCEITKVLNRLQNSLGHNSSLKTATNELETRLLQMSIKREQIRTAVNSFYQSSTNDEILKQMIKRVSPSTSKLTIIRDPMIYYNELIDIVKLSINQQTNLVERFHYEHNRLKHRIDDYHSKIKQRHQLLMQLVEQIVDRQITNEKYIETINMNKAQFDNHTERIAELIKLTEECQILQDENRFLKYRAKENIQTLYSCINQVME